MIVLAQGFADNWIVKGLAIAGGAAVGGLLIGLIGRVATRMLTTRTMPLWGVRCLRVVGGVACGWLVWLCLGSTGTGKVGGEGGLLPGSSTSRDTGKAKVPEEKKNRDKKPGESPSEKTVRIEVLGAKALKILKKPTTGDYYRGYRIQGGEEGLLYDLKGLEEPLRQRREKESSLKVIVVMYKDSPDKDLPVVSELVDWLKQKGLFKKYDPTNQFSPEVRRASP